MGSILVDNLVLLLPQVIVTSIIIIIFMYMFRKDKLLGIGLAVMFIFIIMAVFAPSLAPRPYDTPSKICGENFDKTCRLSPPNSDFIMGTTVFGLDVYSRIIFGAQIPLQMSIIAAIICFSIGVPMGLVSGYYGGKIDSLMKTMSDVIVSFPALLLAILLSTFIRNIPFVDPDSPLRIILVVSFSVGLVYIPTFYVIVRSIVLQLKESAFVEAARSLGASDFTIMFRYILPNVIAAPMAMIPFSMTDAILTGASLAFLGIGIQAPTADWGYDMTKAISNIELAPWLITFPGIMLFMLAFAFSLIGDSLNEKYNPLLQNREA
jgi:peptide/nickel transport system permease protein